MTELAFSVPDGFLDEVKERAAELVAQGVLEQRRKQPPSPWRTVDEAAEYLRCKPQRIYNLVFEEAFPIAKDGKRTLIHQAVLDAYLAGEDAFEVARGLPATPGARTGREPRRRAA